MEGVAKRVFFSHWQKKLLSLVLGFCIWFMIDHSITSTRTFTLVPVRVVNVPSDRAIYGLSPTGGLDRTITLTLTGKKKTIDALQPKDFEVVLDASGKEAEWPVKIGSKNLVSLNPEIDLIHQVTGLTHSSLILRLSPVLTEKVPVHITPPRGEPPEGYQYLGVWPQELSIIVSGPEKEVRELQVKGVEFTIDLSQISAEDLAKYASQKHKEAGGQTGGQAGSQAGGQSEIAFPVPDRMKVVTLGFLGNAKQELASHEAKQLQIFFLKQELFALENMVPIRVFYPFDTLDKYNPTTYPLQTSDLVVSEKGLTFIKKELYAKNVSHLFLDIVREHLELVVSLFEREASPEVPISPQFNDVQQLEETFVSYVMEHDSHVPESTQREFLLARFRKYMQLFRIYTADGKELHLVASLTNRGVTVEENSTPNQML